MPNTHLKSADPRDLNIYTITDFTAGIQEPQFQTFPLIGSPGPNISDTRIMIPQNGVPAVSSQVQFDQATFGCFALPQGGLYHLPYPVPIGTLPAPHNSPVSGGTCYITSAIDLLPLQIGDFLFTYLYEDSSNNWWADLWVWNGFSFTYLDSQKVLSSPIVLPLHIPGDFFNLSKTCLNLSGTITPCVIWGGGTASSITGGSGLETKYYVIESLLTNGVIDSSLNPKIVFTHQSRIISISIFGSSNVTIEQINFTDPPESTSMGTQNEIFYPEQPQGYGAWGSISSGELMLIKQSGGGLIVSGDVFSPYVTNVPSVQSTQALIGNASVTSVGLAYVSQGQGCWAWSGGAQSQKLSQQLGDDFYNRSGTQLGTQDLNNFHTLAWNNFLLTQDNWVYDFTTSAWWRTQLPITSNPTTSGMGVMAAANDGFSFYALPNYIINDSRSQGYLYTTNLAPFDLSQPNFSNWQWLSQPIIVSNGEIVDVEEVIVYVTNGASSSNASASNILEVDIMSFSAGQFTDIQSHVINHTTGLTVGYNVYRFKCYAQTNAIMIMFKVTEAQGQPLVIHSVNIGYKTRFHVAVSGT